MNTGIIKFFNASKGFGFVTADEGGKDIFLPATALGDIQPGQLSGGQRVEFESEPDARGPKISQLRLIGKPVARPASPAPRVTVYCDPSSDVAQEVLDALQKAGLAAQVVDYVAKPIPQDQLKRISLSLGEAGQSLVRRFDPLFLALKLDDRFIGEQEFWTGIIEHPTLINGPVIVLGGKACICRSGKDVKAFLGGGGGSAPPKPKTLSPRLLALLRGDDAPPPPVSVKPALAAKPAPQARAGQGKTEAGKKSVSAAAKTARKTASATPKASTPAAGPRKAAAGAKKKAPAKPKAAAKKAVAPKAGRSKK